jgi:3-dehydroquinate synthase
MNSSTQIIICHSKTSNYEIEISHNLFSKIADTLDSNRNYLIITDSNLEKILGNQLKQMCLDKNIQCGLIFFSAGEEHKNLSTFSMLHEQIALKLDRNSCILALGGGITGDIGGFIASTYMRGIDYIQIPTSLLAMVDSSIGGKLAVNTTIGKNCVGVFNNPKRVIIDPLLLKTLPLKFFIDGMAEVVKHAIISDISYFEYLEQNVEGVQNLDYQTLTKMIYDSVVFKVSIVQKDEKESGIRKILNFGHSIGHALEEVVGYDQISHGYAVSIGMNAACYLSKQRNFISIPLFSRIQSLLKLYNLPLYLSDLDLSGDSDQIFQFLGNDKKNQNGKIVMVLITKIGSTMISDDLTPKEIKDAIQYVIKDSTLS